MTDAQKERQEDENPIHVEEEKKLEFIWNGKKHHIGFLRADLLRPLASVSSIVDGGNIVVNGPQDSYIENRSTGQRMPMSRRNGVFVMQLKAQPSTDATRRVRFHAQNMNSVLRRLA